MCQWAGKSQQPRGQTRNQHCVRSAEFTQGGAQTSVYPSGTAAHSGSSSLGIRPPTPCTATWRRSRGRSGKQGWLELLGFWSAPDPASPHVASSPSCPCLPLAVPVSAPQQRESSSVAPASNGLGHGAHLPSQTHCPASGVTLLPHVHIPPVSAGFQVMELSSERSCCLVPFSPLL